MAESRDFDESGAIAVSLSTTDLSGTGLAKEATTSKDTSVQGISGQGGWPTSGLAKESGGNLDTHTKLLNGTQAGALLGTAGNTLAYEVASQIANGNNTGVAGGTPLLHGVRLVYQNTAIAIPALGNFSTGNITFTRPGYLLRITVLMSGASGSMPSIKCDLSWRVNAQGGAFTAEEFWYVAGGGSQSRRTNGKGPTKGDTLQVSLTNGDAGNSATVQLQIWETTQHIARDDWRGDNAAASQFAGGAANDIAGNVVAQESLSINANTTVNRNFPLYAGQVNIWINQNTAAGSNVQIIPFGDFNTGPALPLANLDWTQAPHSLIGVILPRCWCQLSALNNGGSVATLQYSVIALEYAS